MKHSILIILLVIFSFYGYSENDIFHYPERIKYDSSCLQIEGKDIFVYSGTFHYFRIPKELWADRFAKMKEAGFNAVESYIPWNWHEREMPRSVSDFSKMDMTDLSEWLEMAERFGFYVMVRPGPYICAEWSGGGFPQWLALKRSANINREAWLQSDDPEFIKWNKHWYAAVCRVVVPHQITKKAVGQAGVIMFQVENEYERVNWFPGGMKRKYLEDLTQFARDNGINVPIFTCWTSQSRNVKEGPLQGVIDFVNSYPRWNISKSFGGLTNNQIKTQPGKPLMSVELQGGWYSEVGGISSDRQDGVSPVQTQNIALYAIQRGYSLINFYMLCGGTNLDDWASRQTTTSYDFAAAIHENGSVGEKYRRLSGIGKMLNEHGSEILRTVISDADICVSDPEVEVVLKVSPKGNRFFFIRTEEHTRSHFGTVSVNEKNGKSFVFDFNMEPFGSMVYYVPVTLDGKSAGTWYPECPDPMIRPFIAQDTIRPHTEFCEDIMPNKWKSLKKGSTIDMQEIYGRHFVYYKVLAPAGKDFQVERIGKKVVNRSDEDQVCAMVNGEILIPVSEDKDCVMFRMPEDGKEAILLFKNKGLHHHTNKTVEQHWANGIKWVKSEGKELPLHYAYTENEKGILFSDPKRYKTKDWKTVCISDKLRPQPALLNWYRFVFEMPEKKNGVWVPWNFYLNAKGDGFVYLNGHCIGRYWEKGPQFEFFLPECWLHYGAGKKNIITVSLDGSPSIDKALVVPVKDAAEFR